MNEIEEYLLMIFLESENILDINDISPITCGEFYRWVQFKQEELGRILPDEFEVFASDNGLNYIRANKPSRACLFQSKTMHFKNKIKITVVGE